MTVDELRQIIRGEMPRDAEWPALEWAADEIERLTGDVEDLERAIGDAQDDLRMAQARLDETTESCLGWSALAARANAESDSARRRIAELEEAVLSSGQFRVGGLGP